MNGMHPRITTLSGMIYLSSRWTCAIILDCGGLREHYSGHNRPVQDPVSGALVFGAGTVFIVGAKRRATGRGSTGRTQQAMVNLLADMGVRRDRCGQDWSRSQITDSTPPTSSVSACNNSAAEGQPVVINGVINGGWRVAGVVCRWTVARLGLGQPNTTNWTTTGMPAGSRSHVARRRQPRSGATVGIEVP
jgi:hypothetical protein